MMGKATEAEEATQEEDLIPEKEAEMCSLGSKFHKPYQGERILPGLVTVVFHLSHWRKGCTKRQIKIKNCFFSYHLCEITGNIR